MKDGMNLITEIEKNQFLLVLLEEEMYMNKIIEIVKSLEKTQDKICYVCLSRHYNDVCRDLKRNGIDLKRFHFIDTLSSHYNRMKSTKRCTFLTSPTNLLEIRFAITKVLEEEKCSVVIFDTISTMLIYQKTSNIVKFTHDFLSEEREKSKILYLVFKRDSVPLVESERLIDDLNMFADKTIDLADETE